MRDLVRKMVYGIVYVAVGPHLGKVGYYDDDEGRTGIVYWPDASYAKINVGYLRVASPSEVAGYKASVTSPLVNALMESEMV